jgi:MFS family permease
MIGMDEPQPPRFDPRRRTSVLVALLLVTAMAALEGTIVSTAMPTIIGDLSGLALYSWVFSIYLLTSTVTMPLYGRMADLHGRRRVLLVAIALFVGGAAACAAARSMPALIAARALQGLGAGGVMPIALTVSGDLFSLRERARVQGLFSGIWGGSALVGPMIGAALTLTFGWRSIFWAIVPLGAIAFALVFTQMRETRARRPEPFDLLGGVALAVAITALLSATLQRSGGGGMGAGARVALLVLGLGAAVVFARLQGRTEHPLGPPALFVRRETAAPYVAGALLGTTIFGVDTFVPLFVQGARGGTAAAAGAVVTPIVLFWALSAALAAKAVVAFGFRKTARLGAALILGGFAALVACAVADAGVVWISAACVLIGAGLGPCSISQVLAIQHATHERERGVATALVPFFRTVGGALGVGGLGALLAAGLSRRLGTAAETASRLLAGHHDASVVAAPALRQALEQSLLPVFVVLLALAVVQVAVSGWFPGKADLGPQEQAAPVPVEDPVQA